MDIDQVVIGAIYRKPARYGVRISTAEILPWQIGNYMVDACRQSTDRISGLIKDSIHIIELTGLDVEGYHAQRGDTLAGIRKLAGDASRSWGRC